MKKENVKLVSNLVVRFNELIKSTRIQGHDMRCIF